MNGAAMAAQAAVRKSARTRPARPLISVVAPCRNEADAIAPFYAALDAALKSCDADAEIIFIDDGSTDDTRDRLAGLAREHDNICVVVFSRNFGKEAALSAGLDHAKGDAVIVIDVDLQDPPELIVEFLAKWRDGYDVVYGMRADRTTDTFAKRLTADGFYRLFNIISKVKLPENTGDFRLMDRRVVAAIRGLPERSRFMKGLFAWAGYPSVGVPYASRIVAMSFCEPRS